MPLSATNFVTKGPVMHQDMLNFFNLFTGVMTDQPVTFKNTLSVGGSQGTTTVPVKLYGAVGQTSHLLDLYTDNTNANPGWGIAASGNMGWGPGGAAPIDTTLSRVATQNGHSSDTAGILITPYLEVAGNISAQTYLFSNSATLSGPTANPFYLLVNNTLAINTINERLRPVAGAPASGGGVALETTDGWAYVYSAMGAMMTYNAYEDASNAWQRYNTANPSFALAAGSTGMVLSTAAAASGTIAWASRFSVDVNGNVNVGGQIVAAGQIYSSGSGVGAGVNVSASAGDLWSNRGNATGYVWFGNTSSHYLGFDGSYYQMPTSALNVGGPISANNVYYFSGIGSSVYIQWNGSAITFSQPINAGSYVYFQDSGAWLLRDPSIANCVVAGNSIRVQSALYLEATTSGALISTFGNPGYLYFGVGASQQYIFRRSTDGATLTTIQASNGTVTSASYFFASSSSGSYAFLAPNTASGAGQGYANAWINASARRFKYNIVPMRDPIDILLDERLHAVEYDHDWVLPKGAMAKGPRAGTAHGVGLIADDWLEVVPEIVSVIDDEVMGMDYGRVAAIVFEALKLYIKRSDARLAVLEAVAKHQLNGAAHEFFAPVADE